MVFEKKRNLALVLSGGSARGLAHIGVLEVLEENHIPIDAVVGTSMGALVGGIYASGNLKEAKEEIDKEIWRLDKEDQEYWPNVKADVEEILSSE